MKESLKILGLGLVAGTVYLWITNPETSYTFGIHNYAILALLSVVSAFIARNNLHTEHEKAILLTVTGFVIAMIAPHLFEALANNPTALEAAFNQAFITLFFAGHAAMIGTFSATLYQKITDTSAARYNQSRYNQPNKSEGYYKYPVTE